MQPLIRSKHNVESFITNEKPTNDKCNKFPPPSEASLSLIRESRHLVLVLPTNGLDTCINRLLANTIILIMVSLIMFLTRLEGKEVEDDLLYSEISAALAAGTKIIPVTADFQVLTYRHGHIGNRD